jgi:hypothetical protein
MDDSFNFLNVNGFVGYLNYTSTLITHQRWVSSAALFRSRFHLWFLNSSKLIDVLANIFVFSRSFISSWLRDKSTVLRHIDTNVPNDFCVELWHINEDVQVVIEILADITWMLVFVAISYANESVIELLERPS